MQPALIVLAVAQPVCGVVFVLDGVLIGAGDAKYLAIAGVLNLVPFVPALVVLAVLGVGGAAGLAWLSVAFFGVYMLARLATLGWRVRGAAWMTAGPDAASVLRRGVSPRHSAPPSSHGAHSATPEGATRVRIRNLRVHRPPARTTRRRSRPRSGGRSGTCPRRSTTPPCAACRCRR